MVGRVIGFIANNWTLKLAAVALAILLWLGVRASTPKRTMFRNVPVQVDLRDPDWRLVGEPIPSTVSVTVEGPTSELMALAGNPPRIVLPVDRVSDSTETQVVPPQWIRIPQGLDLRRTLIVGLRPDTIRLRYERVVSKTLPVQVRTRGDLPEGLALALPIATNPSVVDVRGPGRVLDDLDSIPLLPVELSGLTGSTNVPTGIDSTAVRGLGLRITPREINVILRVLPADSQPALQGETVARRRPAARIR